jgi:serine/threonine-protein kinase
VAFFGNVGGDRLVYALRKVQTSGGNPVTIVNNVKGGEWGSGAWLPDGTIVFASDQGTPLQRVSADGGTPQAITMLAAAEKEHTMPCLLPDGGVLFSVGFRSARRPQVEMIAPDGSGRHVVLENASTPHYVAPGYLLFQRDDLVMLAPFDGKRGVVTGPAAPLNDAIHRDGSTSDGPIAQIAASAAGTIAYVASNDEAGGTLTLVAPDGTATSIGGRERFNWLRGSPDGEQVAVTVGQADGTYRVAIVDLVRGASTRLARQGSEAFPAWHPNGRQLAVWAAHDRETGIFVRDLDGGGQRLLLSEPEDGRVRNMDWSPDGTQLAYTRQSGGIDDVYIVNIADPSKPMPVLQGTASKYTPRFSPDGRWLAYISKESGRNEAYVLRLPAGMRARVSGNGANGIAWSRDGRTLFFTEPGDTPRMMRASLMFAGDGVQVSEPAKLFDLRAPGPTGAIEPFAGGNNAGTRWDALPDGRFVMIRDADPRGTREIVLIQNFAEEAKRLLSAK